MGKIFLTMDQKEVFDSLADNKDFQFLKNRLMTEMKPFGYTAESDDDMAFLAYYDCPDLTLEEKQNGVINIAFIFNAMLELFKACVDRGTFEPGCGFSYTFTHLNVPEGTRHYPEFYMIRDKGSTYEKKVSFAILGSDDILRKQLYADQDRLNKVVFVYGFIGTNHYLDCVLRNLTPTYIENCLREHPL